MEASRPPFKASAAAQFLPAEPWRSGPGARIRHPEFRLSRSAMSLEARDAATYRTVPERRGGMPPGIPFIVGNEAAERFSFYGMKAILVVFMTRYLMDDSGSAAVMGDAEARSWYHLFTSAVYFTPIFGALLADLVFGKYRTILGLSLVYCLGHLALALDDSRLGLSIGLGLIAAGSGGRRGSWVEGTRSPSSSSMRASAAARKSSTSEKSR